MATGTLSQLDEEHLRLEAELESVRRELDAYNNSSPVAINSRTSSSHQTLYHPLRHRHSDSNLDNANYRSRKGPPFKRRDSVDYDHRLGGENPFYGAQMMQMLLDQQARVYSKESELLRKEMDQLKVSNWKLLYLVSLDQISLLLLVSYPYMVLTGYDKRCSKEQVSSSQSSSRTGYTGTTSSFISQLSIPHLPTSWTASCPQPSTTTGK